jgi:hypothetical protein
MRTINFQMDRLRVYTAVVRKMAAPLFAKEFKDQLLSSSSKAVFKDNVIMNEVPCLERLYFVHGL